MKSKASTIIVAIASVSGGGKTTAVNGLTYALPNTKALYFDEYDFVGPENMMDWLDQGNDYNEWDLSPLLADLDKLLAEPLDCILLDFPFARQHAKSNPYIDFTIFIDTPLDLALSRRIERDFAGASTEEILADIQFYAKRGRAGYLQMLQDIKPDSDAVIDGSGSATEIVQTLADKINSWK